MKEKATIIVLLLVLTPTLAELLSASAPPIVFFNPVGFILLVCLYGCGALLIREAKARWNLQWTVIFLAVAYGIVEEGLMVKSFFNPGWEDLGNMSEYGMYFGVQWPWTIKLILYHAFVSMLIPITIVDYLWPAYRDAPLLSKRGIIIAASCISFVTILGMIFCGTQSGDTMIPYHAAPILLIAGFVIVGLLVWAAYRFKDSRVNIRGVRLLSPAVFGILGFLFMALNLIVSDVLAEKGVYDITTIYIQCVLVLLTLLFFLIQIFHKDVTKRHIAACITGSIMFLIILTPIHEFVDTQNPDPTNGMLVVGIISMILLLMWRRVVLR